MLVAAASWLTIYDAAAIDPPWVSEPTGGIVFADSSWTSDVVQTGKCGGISLSVQGSSSTGTVNGDYEIYCANKQSGPFYFYDTAAISATSTFTELGSYDAGAAYRNRPFAAWLYVKVLCDSGGGNFTDLSVGVMCNAR